MRWMAGGALSQPTILWVGEAAALSGGGGGGLADHCSTEGRAADR